MEDPAGAHWGYDLRKRSGVRSGVLYPLLQRLLDSGWLSDGWEDPAQVAGRPPRRYYKLTELGRRELSQLAAAAPPRPVRPGPVPARPALGDVR